MSTQSEASSTSSSAATSSTASSCSANGVTYYTGQQVTMDGLTYTIRCSTDNSQGAYDIVGVNSGGFSKCFSACAASPQCRGWTFSGVDFGNCYLKVAEGTYSPADETIISVFLVDSRPDTGAMSKQSSSTASVAATSSAATSSNAPSSTPSGSGFDCAAVASNNGSFTPYTNSNVKQYNIACNHEVGGSFLDVIAANTFGDCFPICDKMSGCAGFAWLQDNGPGNCYLKTGFNPLNTIGDSNADVAIMVSQLNGGIPDQPSGSGSATASASATASSTPAIGCSTFDTSKYPDYTLECLTDRNGGNLVALQSQSFDGCFPLCKQRTGCIGFSYAGGTGPGTCYLKQELVAPNANANVDTAYITSQLPTD